MIRKIKTVIFKQFVYNCLGCGDTIDTLVANLDMEEIIHEQTIEIAELKNRLDYFDVSMAIMFDCLYYYLKRHQRERVLRPYEAAIKDKWLRHKVHNTLVLLRNRHERIN